VRLSIWTIVAVAAVPCLARAAPAADLVIVWAPNRSVAPVGAVAHELGAALIDRSPARAALPTPIAPLVKRGIDAYDALRFTDAASLLDQARDAADRTGAAGLTPAELSDLFLYRGLVQAQLDNPAAAWDELATALVIDPARLLDPSRFPPRVVADVERARVAVGARAVATLAIQAPPTCTLTIDGVASTGTFTGRLGAHWVRATCTDRPAWGARITLTGVADHLAIAGAPYAAPDDAELVVQARVAAARAFVIVEVRGAVGTARLLGVDGRERDRRSVAITGDLAPLAAAVRSLLRPARPPAVAWYRARWVWAAGAAALAAAIAIPVTAALAGDSSSTTAGLKIEPPSW
jgi:hypothetical protein